MADGLYARASFFKTVRAAGKHVIAVLKDEGRELARDVLGLCKSIVPRKLTAGTTKRQVWDIEQLNSWTQVGMPVRVVRSLETTTVKRQNGGALDTQTTQWMWVTTIPSSRLPAEQLVDSVTGDGVSRTMRSMSWSPTGMRITSTSMMQMPYSSSGS